MLMQIAHEIDRMGGRAFLVGGSVRDAVMGIEPKDFDVEVFGLSPEALIDLLCGFGRVDTVGASFGVIKLWAGGEDFDFSLPRRESKTGSGHKGFMVELDESLTPVEAAQRRDFTWDAMMQDVITGEVFDFFGGMEDIAAGVIRATSEHFVDDPAIRTLRGFQFASRFKMVVAPRTAQMCAEMFDSLADETVERVWSEFEKWAVKGVAPSFGLRFLVDTSWIHHFPEIETMIGLVQQKSWHPEGCVFEHICLAIDIAAEIATREQLSVEDRMTLVFAALCHDCGKVSTTEFVDGAIRSRAHDKAGVEPTRKFMSRIGAPEWLVEKVVPLVREHMVFAHPHMPTARAIRRLGVRVAPSTIQMLSWVMECDQRARGPAGHVHPVTVKMVDMAEEEHCREEQPKPILMGRHLIEMGMRPSREFGVILASAFEAQLEGNIFDLGSARQWVHDSLGE